ncbi:dynamin-1-like protein [Nilaparvata lugens]|uniref:dynamin-1-like protein n=1 Tax=Nilaparvata lugens TaxID=108931 RepID=UPI00193E35E2|nr:dynamin-1-like protein [Nilaparvata lugens]
MLTAIRNASGTRPGLFVPEVSFELLVKKQIAKLEEPSIRCADLVHEELENLVKVRAQNCNPLLKRFPALHKRITDTCLQIIKTQLPVTHHMIRQTVAIQLAYINTNHPDFIREVHGVNNPPEASCRVQESVTSLTGASWEDRTGRLQEAAHTHSHESLKPNNSLTNSQDRESHDSIVIEHLIKTYFNIVRKTVQDNVPKIIMHSMVNHVTENLQQLLVSQLYTPELIGDLLTESEEVTKFRKDIEERISCLRSAADILQSLKDPTGSREGLSRMLVL